MLSRPQEQPRLADLREQVQRAHGVTPTLMSEVLAQEEIRPPASNSPSAARLRRLIEAEAWTDASLALIALALPRWQVVRLVFDGGEWCCALSRHWQMPDWLDHAVEARHEVLPLAILGAFLAAREASRAEEMRHTVPQCRSHEAILHALCCENFA